MPELRAASGLLLTVAGLAACYYLIEPWAVTFVDDGPYYSREFPGQVEDLPLHSAVELWRFRRLVYVLESRTLTEDEKSVLVLRTPGGTVHWARVPVKPDGELGEVEVRRANLTWYGGWRIAIKPANQEGGSLYLSSLGRLRFFNHSW